MHFLVYATGLVYRGYYFISVHIASVIVLCSHFGGSRMYAFGFYTLGVHNVSFTSGGSYLGDAFLYAILVFIFIMPLAGPMASCRPLAQGIFRASCDHGGGIPDQPAGATPE